MCRRVRVIGLARDRVMSWSLTCRVSRVLGGLLGVRFRNETALASLLVKPGIERPHAGEERQEQNEEHRHAGPEELGGATNGDAPPGAREALDEDEEDRPQTERQKQEE